MQEHFSHQLKNLDKSKGYLYYLIYRHKNGKLKLSCEKMRIEELSMFEETHEYFDVIFLPVFKLKGSNA